MDTSKYIISGFCINMPLVMKPMAVQKQFSSVKKISKECLKNKGQTHQTVKQWEIKHIFYTDKKL